MPGGVSRNGVCGYAFELDDSGSRHAKDGRSSLGAERGPSYRCFGISHEDVRQCYATSGSSIRWIPFAELAGPSGTTVVTEDDSCTVNETRIASEGYTFCIRKGYQSDEHSLQIAYQITLGIIHRESAKSYDSKLCIALRSQALASLSTNVMDPSSLPMKRYWLTGFMSSGVTEMHRIGPCLLRSNLARIARSETVRIRT